MFWLSFLIHVPLLCFLAFFIARKWSDRPLKRYYFPALFLKLISGILLGIIYLFIYQGASDSLVYFQISTKFNALLSEDPGTYFSYFFFNGTDFDKYLGYDISHQPRALFFLKVISAIGVFTFNNYWVISMYFSFFSFLGLYHLSNTIVRIFKVPFLSVLISFLFFPSVLFWSSGILKESILMGALGFAASFFLLWVHRFKRPDFIRIVIFIMLLLVIFALKFYYFAVLVPVLFSYFVSLYLCRLTLFKNLAWLHPFILIALFFVLIFSVSFIHPHLNPSVFMESLMRNYEATLSVSDGRNVFYFPELSPDFSSLLMQFPKAALIGLFRPLPGDISSVIGYSAMMENVLVVLFFLLSAIYLFIRKPSKSNNLILTAVLMYVIVLAFLLPVASPNWGSLVRYKVGYMPFLLLLITFRNPLILYLEQRFLKEKETRDSISK
jgi:hypothetical protein